jgi:hypothetical protein
MGVLACDRPGCKNIMCDYMVLGEFYLCRVPRTWRHTGLLAALDEGGDCQATQILATGDATESEPADVRVFTRSCGRGEPGEDEDGRAQAHRRQPSDVHSEEGRGKLETALAASVERVKKAEAERDEAIANLEAMEDAEAARDQRYDIGDD